MINFSRICLLWALTMCGLWAFLPTPQAAGNDPAKPASQRDAQAVIIQLRMKKYVKEVGLTEKQQKTIQALLEQEAGRVAKIKEDESLSVLERNKKHTEIQKETYSKIKPLLTAEQLERWEKMMSKPDKAKKKK